jgi:hypothetical protein
MAEKIDEGEAVSSTANCRWRVQFDLCGTKFAEPVAEPGGVDLVSDQGVG